jgi:hypothetical protein
MNDFFTILRMHLRRATDARRSLAYFA